MGIRTVPSHSLLRLPEYPFPFRELRLDGLPHCVEVDPVALVNELTSERNLTAQWDVRERLTQSGAGAVRGLAQPQELVGDGDLGLRITEELDATSGDEAPNSLERLEHTGYA